MPPTTSKDSPEPLFLDHSIASVRDSSIRMPRVEPWATEYCTAIEEHRYGDAIWARYHMDGRATNEGYTNTRMKDDGTIEHDHVAVYDLIMEDARDYARESPEPFRQALAMYSHTDSMDNRKDILDGLMKIGAGSGAAALH
ncbi:hypothetical protein BO82DRAFT_358121 [Aspergillus uvarum CBS 121591]|uniref:Uncharacterized protein n=1 Tax=Aspergillus uvarum CBS 121591 TaxID=1448315 RepID=A0A319BV86_9EURO|nr:hypothetical protein BO82DRAFT_358121 [Aspergillus uvarum CBS 121591]PYH77616.1 hypothetical protein BO82DRAFT_358121 [Aspergillus uvarum CBS 121591]